MKKFNLTMIALLFAGFFGLSTAFAGEKDKGQDIDLDKSKVEWLGRKVTGQHNGDIKLKSGKIVINEGRLVGGSFTVDMTSINVLDLQGDMKGKLEGHLKSDDFFGVIEYPDATLTINKAIPKEGSRYEIVGQFTIKGMTQDIVFDATMDKTDKDATIFNAELDIDRAKFNIRYGSGSFFDNLGDNLIYDNFKITTTIVLPK